MLRSDGATILEMMPLLASFSFLQRPPRASQARQDLAEGPDA